MAERKLEGRGTISVNVTTDGLIDIVQENIHSDDSVISMSPHDVPTIVKWLRECAKEVKGQKKTE